MMKLANVTLIRDEPSAILAKQYVESVPFWKITWSHNHVIFHVNRLDDYDIVAYRSDRVYEIVTEDLRND
jgi:hypothetical protein